MGCIAFWACQALRTHTFRQAKVENLYASSLRDENVGGFDVTMNDAFAVSCIESIGDLDGNRNNPLCIQRTSGYQYFRVTPSRYSIAMNARPSWIPIS